MALHENLLYDRRTGQPLTAGYYCDRIPTHRDAPPIEVIFIESDDGYGPYGAKSIGESGIILSPAADRQRDLQRDRQADEGSADHPRQDPGRRSHENLYQRQCPRRPAGGDAGAETRTRPDRRRRLPAAAAICSGW